MYKTTINHNGVSLQVEYNYQPFEPAETGPEAQYPGCEEAIELNTVIHNGGCILGILSDTTDLEDEILKDIKENGKIELEPSDKTSLVVEFVMGDEWDYFEPTDEGKLKHLVNNSLNDVEINILK